MLAISGLLLDKPLGMTDCLVGLVVAGKLAELVGISDWLMDELAALSQTSIWLESSLAWIGDLSTLSAWIGDLSTLWASVVWLLLVHRSIGLAGTSVLLIHKATGLAEDSGLLVPESTELVETFLDLPLTRALLTVKSAI